MNKTIFLFSLILHLSLIGCQEKKTEKKVSEPQKAAQLIQSIMLSNDEKEPVGQVLTGDKILEVNDYIFTGETVFTGSNIFSDIDFDEFTKVIIDQNSSFSVQKPNQVSLNTGIISVHRKTGSTTPFVVLCNGKPFSVIRGIVHLIQKEKGQELIVEAGEVLNISENQYLRTGQEWPKTEAAALSSQITNRLEQVSVSPVEINLEQPKITRGIGTLEARNPQTNQLSQDALKLKDHLIDISINNGVAITQIQQSFTNQSAATVEATYKFVLPADAVITRLALDVNGKIEEGEVIEKKRARAVFNKIVSDSVVPKDPALLEWERGSSFSLKIFPLKKNETRTVFLSYMTPVTGQRGSYKYNYPINKAASSMGIENFQLKASVNSHHPIVSINTPFYKSDLEKQKNTANIEFQALNQVPKGDFIITWQTKNQQDSIIAATQTTPTGQSYAMFLVNPPLVEAKEKERRVMAILDVSASMEQELLNLSYSSLMELLGSLGNNTKYSVLACDSDCQLFDEWKSPDAQAIIKTYDKLKTIKPMGASNIAGSFSRAFELADDSIPTDIVYFGDFVATSALVERKRLFETITTIKPENVNIFTIGVGPGTDLPLMKKVANNSGGANLNLQLGDSASKTSFLLANMLEGRGLRDIKIQFLREQNQLDLEPVIPEIGFLQNGEEILITAQIKGKLPKDGAKAQLLFEAKDPTGKTIKKNYQVILKQPPRAPGVIGLLHASRQIERLEFEDNTSKEIIQLSRKFRIASKLTSWIVLENDRMFKQFNIQRTSSDDFEPTAISFTDGVEERQVSAAPAAPATQRSSAPKTPARAAASKSSSRRESTSLSSSPLNDLLSMQEASPEPARSAKFPPPRRLVRYDVQINSPRKRHIGDSQTSSLEQAIKKNPLSRVARRSLVRHLAKGGDRTKGIEHAWSWLQTDPYSNDIYEFLGAEKARTGDFSEAIRIYSGFAEPGTGVKGHERLALMYEDLHMYFAAAGHYFAVYQLEKNSQQRQEAYYKALYNLALSGQYRWLDYELSQALENREYRLIKTRLENLAQGVSQGILPAASSAKALAPLRVILVSEDCDKLEIGIIDPFGRMISVLNQRNATYFKLSDKSKRLTLNPWQNGIYQVVLFRTDKENSSLKGHMHIELRNQKKTIPFNFIYTENPIADVTYRKI